LPICQQAFDVSAEFAVGREFFSRFFNSGPAFSGSARILRVEGRKRVEGRGSRVEGERRRVVGVRCWVLGARRIAELGVSPEFPIGALVFLRFVRIFSGGARILNMEGRDPVPDTG